MHGSSTTSKATSNPRIHESIHSDEYEGIIEPPPEHITVTNYNDTCMLLKLHSCDAIQDLEMYSFTSRIIGSSMVLCHATFKRLSDDRWLNDEVNKSQCVISLKIDCR